MSDTPLGKMIIQMGIDDVNFAKGITGVTKQLTALKGDLRASETSFAAFGKGIDGVEGPMNILTKTIETQKRQLDLLKKSYQGSLIDGKATGSTQNYATQISRANAQLVELQAKLKAAAVEQYKQTSILPKMSAGLDKVSGGLNSVANKSLPATVAITGVFAKGIQDATNFNGKMTEIQALLSDGTAPEILAKEIDTLSSKSKEWAQQYGISTDSINDGMEEMIKRGYSFNQTVGAMPAVLDASKASGEDFGTVMNTSTSILEQFNLKSNDSATMLKNTQRVTDSLTFVANETAAGFADMGDAMQYVGPVAHGLGMDVEQTAAAIGLLSNNGIEGQAAGTGLRSVLTSLEKPTNTSEVAFQKLGISTDDFKKGTLTLPGIIQDITKSTNGMTDAQKASLLAQAFGTKGQTAMNVLVSQGAQALEDLTNKTDKATGYTKKLSDQMNNSDKNAFAKAKASLEVLSIDLGEKLLPSILPVVKEVDNLAGSFAKLDPQTQQFIIKMAIGAAAIAPTAKALSGLTGILSTVTGGLAKLGAAGAGKLAFSGLATEAEGATAAITGAGGLEAGIGGIAPVLAGIGPGAVAALGVAGLAGLIIGVKTVVDEAEERLKYFGTVNVPPETVSKVETFKGKINDLAGAAQLFQSEGVQAFDAVSKAISGLKGTTDSDIDAATKKLVKEAQNLGFGKDVIDNIKNGGTDAKNVVQQATDDITNIYKNGSEAQGKLSLMQQAQVATDQQKIAAQEIEALGVSGSQKKQLMQALSGDISHISTQQAQEYTQNIQEILNKSTDTFKQKKGQLDDLLNKGKITQDQYNTQETQIQNEHEATTKAYLGTLEDMIMKQGEGFVKGTKDYQVWAQASNNILHDYGVKVDDLAKKNGTAIDAITQSAQSLQEWNSIPDPVKKLLGDNSDFKNNEAEASQILVAWNLATPEAKKLLAVNLAANPTMSAQQIINTLTGKTVPLGAVDNTGSGVNQAAITISKLQPKTVGIDADPSQANTKVQGLLSSIPTSRTIQIIASTSVAPKATGDSNFAGGLAMVNDQKGPLYHELITLPTGQSFIPQGRDVVMPLPKGTSILKASDTAKMFSNIPRFEDGIGTIPANAKIFRNMRAIQQQLVVNAPVVESGQQIDLLTKILEALSSNGTNREVANAIKTLAKRPAVSVFDTESATSAITKQQNQKNLIESMMRGQRP